MRKNNILMKLKEKFTPTIYSIGKEYYMKRIGGITALYADGNLVTLDGEFQENNCCVGRGELRLHVFSKL